MAQRKKDKQVEPVVASVVVEQMLNEPGTCISCRHYLTGQWYGPRCTNPGSPYKGQYVREVDTCAEHTPKQPRGTAPEPAVALPDDGLYDPEPVSDLKALLDRETESPEDVQGA